HCSHKHTQGKERGSIHLFFAQLRLSFPLRLRTPRRESETFVFHSRIGKRSRRGRRGNRPPFSLIPSLSLFLSHIIVFFFFFFFFFFLLFFFFPSRDFCIHYQGSVSFPFFCILVIIFYQLSTLFAIYLGSPPRQMQIWRR